MEEIYFVYVSADRRIAAYSLSNRSEHGNYMQGYSHTSGGLRTFRKERFIEFFDCIEDAAAHADKLNANLELFDFSSVDLNRNRSGEFRYKRYESPGMLAPLDFSGAHEICFTGFKKEDKERLSKLASEAGMIVRKDVTVNLHFLCGGYNAGPKKLEAARTKGSMILREPEFIALIETGELPDSYDNQ
ncbi:BRCT domain-containing protein [Serratia marcescens]|uniref:BRCT domain-containing protein n=1 Tax=Serratia marcescens TaxID=615 RepID=A0A5C7C8G0_SERMA|nr:BRCT domain-containing protein [Serratia marcescens]TXE33221.1 BRCT domain-containing protein [Serratia marcescens]TXE65255.1 BRCT domain-containing protein [Serratia marcescens]